MARITLKLNFSWNEINYCKADTKNQLVRILTHLVFWVVVRTTIPTHTKTRVLSHLRFFRVVCLRE